MRLTSVPAATLATRTGMTRGVTPEARATAIRKPAQMTATETLWERLAIAFSLNPQNPTEGIQTPSGAS